MKTYRIQVRYAGLYFDNTTQAEYIDNAVMNFAEAVKQGTVKVANEPLYRPDRLYVTYEEVSNDTTQQTVRQEA